MLSKLLSMMHGMRHLRLDMWINKLLQEYNVCRSLNKARYEIFLFVGFALFGLFFLGELKRGNLFYYIFVHYFILGLLTKGQSISDIFVWGDGEFILQSIQVSYRPVRSNIIIKALRRVLELSHKSKMYFIYFTQ